MSMGGMALYIAVSWLIPNFPGKYRTVLRRHQHVIERHFADKPKPSQDEMKGDPEKIELFVRRTPANEPDDQW